jgi:hypothetical protein
MSVDKKQGKSFPFGKIPSIVIALVIAAFTVGIPIKKGLHKEEMIAELILEVEEASAEIFVLTAAHINLVEEHEAIVLSLQNEIQFINAAPSEEREHPTITPSDILLISRIVDNEAGNPEVSTEEERRCIARSVVNICRGSEETFNQCLRRRRSIYGTTLSDMGTVTDEEYVVRFPKIYESVIKAAQGNYPEECEDSTNWFSPVSMNREPSDLIEIEPAFCSQEMCSTCWEENDGVRQFFHDPEEQRAYHCARNGGFLNYMRSGGGYRDFGSIGTRALPRFAARMECVWDDFPGVNTDRFVFCHNPT